MEASVKVQISGLGVRTKDYWPRARSSALEFQTSRAVI